MSKNEVINFTANYSNTTGGFISSATCRIYFTDGNYLMDEQTTEYNYSRTFATGGSKSYNVTCNKTGYNPVTTLDTASIIDPASVPEFSLMTLSLGLMIILIGIVIVRKRK